MEKATLKFTVATCKHPVTKVTILRPVITERPSMNLRSLVEYAKTAGYARGQTRDLEGTFTGILQAAQDRALAGYSLNLTEWFQITGKLKGTVDATRQLTSANEYHVVIVPKTELKASADQYSWQCVDDTGSQLKIIGLAYVGSPDDKKLMKNKDIQAQCKNGSYVAAAGDTVEITWETTDETGAKTPHSAFIVPTEVDCNHYKFAWPTALDDAPVGTVVNFSFRSHAGGKPDGALKIAERDAEIVAA